MDKINQKTLKLLAQYIPIVARVHGGSHPEFHEVHRIYDQIKEKIKNNKKPDLTKEFSDLREITDNYKVPSDVCESYEAVYHMLAELDIAYHK
ncbi:MAG: iron-sulfur cluster repair di-iron protein, ric [Bacillota bacterium]|jgi:iron-sulfur cluster repair protein YtfE (RIC family)|nr:iron-sulfur cluster repair di-iron protein, ric [Bacillota bacterium]HHU43080.1 iron-sulfur cluster repair di-iron protein, ric [Clostridiales bacterium]